MDQLVALIDRVRPDYLKWDNNFWINCDRTGHGHGPADGNLAHVQALYGILDELRRRYPGPAHRKRVGRRLAPRLRHDGLHRHGVDGRPHVAGLARAPQPRRAHVRVSAGLPAVVPDRRRRRADRGRRGSAAAHAQPRRPAFSASPTGPICSTTTRRRCCRQQIAEYKTYRDIITQSNATLLTAQAPVDDNGWDVLQEVTDDARSALIFGFKGDGEDGRLVVRPSGLLPDAIYDVQSLDVGPIGAARGDLLMQDGIELIHAGGSRAHVLILKAR